MFKLQKGDSPTCQVAIMLLPQLYLTMNPADGSAPVDAAALPRTG